MEKLSNSELQIMVSAAGAELCSIMCNGKEYFIYGRLILLTGTDIRRCFSL